MHRLLALFFLTLYAACSHPANQDQVEVTFELHAPGLAADAPLHISGDIRQLGSWQPDRVEMEFVGDETWRRTIRLDEPRSVEYKYTLGSWEREGADGNGYSLRNFTARIEGDTTVRETVVAWTDGSRNFEVRGQVTGTVEYYPAMAGDDIQARDVLVWLPPGYGENPAQRYGVLYMHDGQNIVDPATANFGIDWEVDETADRLIRAGSIPPVIVVGMNSTADRNAEYSPGRKGEAYMGFIVNTLKPFIDRKYRTLPGREHTSVAGSSMGGLISFMLAWQHYDVFSRAICMSPAFRIRGHDLMSPVLAKGRPQQEIYLYIDNGGIGLEEDLQQGIDDMVAELRGLGFSDGENLYYTVDPDATHNEAAWAARLPAALEWALSR